MKYDVMKGKHTFPRHFARKIKMAKFYDWTPYCPTNLVHPHLMMMMIKYQPYFPNLQDYNDE